MFPTNWYFYLLSALIPLVIGALYYNPKVLGKQWMNVNGFRMEDLQGGNRVATVIFTFLFGLVISLALVPLVVHQTGLASLMMPDLAESGSQAQSDFNAIMKDYGHRYRTFGHGALHGAFTAIFFGLPLIGMTALHERRGWKYIFIHLGFWIICLTLMGGLLCSTLVWASPA